MHSLGIFYFAIGVQCCSGRSERAKTGACITNKAYSVIYMVILDGILGHVGGDEIHVGASNVE